MNNHLTFLESWHKYECHANIPRFYKSSSLEVFLGKCVLNICNKFTGEHPYRSVVSIKFFGNFIEITLRPGCCPVILLHYILSERILSIPVVTLLIRKWFRISSHKKHNFQVALQNFSLRYLIMRFLLFVANRYFLAPWCSDYHYCTISFN